MAQPITNADLDKNKPQQNQGGQNQSAQNQTSNNQVQGNSQIANNYSGQQPAANPNQQKGSGYTNIQRIVGANQANKLGQTIGQNIQQAGQKAQQNIGQAQQQFTQQAGANRADTVQNQQLIQQAFQDPTQLINDPNQVGKFQNLIGGVYQGPQGLQNAGQLQAQAQDVNQLGQAIGSAGGRQGLLQRFVGTPQYTSGQQTMDSLLLGATGGKDLTAARQATLGIAKQANQAEQGATQAAQEYANRAQQLGKDVQNKFGQTVAQQQQGLVQQAQTAQQQRDKDVAALQQQLGEGTLTQDIASKLGITGDDMTYNVDASKFIGANPLQANAQNIASAQDYARMQALQKLGGQFAPQQASQALSQFQNPTQAGSFARSQAYNLDAPGFQEARNAAKTAYDTQLNAATGRTSGANEIVNRLQQISQMKADPITNDPMQGIDPFYDPIRAQQQADEQVRAQAAREAALQYGLNTSNSLGRLQEWATKDNLAKAQANEAAVRQLLEQQYGSKKYNIQ